ncbi:MAG: hypothetical protein ACI9CD_000109 [Candidatus Deianiraeaceae bacterium]|jgi:hypothetical protein
MQIVFITTFLLIDVVSYDNVQINKGGFIGCTHNLKSLEYFKVRCYGDCWEEWQ